MRRFIFLLALGVLSAAACSFAADFPSVTFEKNGKTYRITAGEERVIVRGIRPEEGIWGPYQFPRPYFLGDR